MRVTERLRRDRLDRHLIHLQPHSLCFRGRQPDLALDGGSEKTRRGSHLRLFARCSTPLQSPVGGCLFGRCREAVTPAVPLPTFSDMPLSPPPSPTCERTGATPDCSGHGVPNGCVCECDAGWSDCVQGGWGCAGVDPLAGPYCSTAVASTLAPAAPGEGPAPCDPGLRSCVAQASENKERRIE